MMMSMGVEHDGRSQMGSRRGKVPKRSWATTIVFTLLAVFFVVPLLSPQVRWELYARYHAYASTTGRLPSFVPSAAANASRDDGDDDFDYAGSCQMDMEFLSSHADGRKLIVSWANYAYYDFVLNWAWHLRKLDVNNFVVGAMDEHTYASLKEDGIPTFPMFKQDKSPSSSSSSDDETEQTMDWGSSRFHDMGLKKIELVGLITSCGFDLLLSDVDTVWLRDPYEYFDRFPQADVLTSSDNLEMTTTDGGLEIFPDAGAAANIGIMHFNHRARELGFEWLRRLEQGRDRGEVKWDQDVFNDIMRDGFDWDADEDCWMPWESCSNKRIDRLFYGANATALIGILPVSLFCSGHTYFVQDMPEVIDREPYVVHATFQFSGKVGKRHRFREHLLWNDPPEYFRRDGGFLSFDLAIPDNLLHGEGSFSVDGHIRLVEYQLRRIVYAMIIASILGRALVFPPLWCQYDRFWGELEDGRIAGASGPKRGQPFVCPLDHVMSIEALERGRLSTSPLKPDLRRLDYREYSFLHNERYPRANNTDSNGGADDVLAGARIISEASMAELKRTMTEEDVRTQFASDSALLHFEQMTNVFVDDDFLFAKWGEFRAGRSLLESFCCENGGRTYFDQRGWDGVRNPLTEDDE